ncbi:MAG: tetratricopeptide repeat-containing glycosyltransferase family protein [Verrucomicrobiota bacterium]
MTPQETLENAVLCVTSGRFAEAITLCEQCLKAQPTHVGAWNLLGVAYRGNHSLLQSVQAHERALELAPDDTDSRIYLGESLLQCNRISDALTHLQKAVQMRPESAHAWSSLGYAQTLHKDFESAITALETAKRLDPTNPDILNRLGLAYRGAKQTDAAIDHYQQAIRLRPNFAQALNNLGAAQQLKLQFNEALVSYNQALEIQPEYLSVWNNLGTLFQSQHHLPEAIQAYQKAQRIDPKYFQAHVNEGHARLLMGDFGIGWLKHEYRWLATRTNPQRSFTQPLWRGEESLAGKTILLHSEQGLGDTIQFIRYPEPLTQLGATVLLEIQPSLLRLAATGPGVHSVHTYGNSLPAFDFHCPLMSLPLAFKTTLETIPNQTPYLSAPTDALIKWKAIVPRGANLKVGIVWRGNPTHENDANRSVPFTLLEPLLDLNHADFVNLQLGLSDPESNAFHQRSNCMDPTGEILDYADTAALITQLDLVISADTSVAHLAGALGKPVWILLPFSPDWRWMLDRKDSPWYPSAQLFRQPTPQAWMPVISALTTSLSTVAQAFNSSTADQ